MSRHRNVRKLDYNEEYGYEDVYGKSLEDEVAISPSTAAQFIFHREQRETPSLKSYFDSREHGSPDAGRKPQISSATSPLATVSTGVAPGGWREGGRDSMDGGTGVSSDGWHGRGKGEESIDGNSRVSSGSWQRREERGSADVSTREHVPSVPPGFKPLHKEEGGAYGEGGGGVRMKTEAMRPLEGAVGASPTPVRVSTLATPKRGFVTGGFQEEERRIRSGSSSPARSPSPTADHTSRTYPPPVQRSTYRSKHQQIDVVEEYKKRQQESKGQINLVVIGHVDAGKSTLMGHLLYLLGHVSKKAMHKYEQESQKVGKGSFAYAWVLDETGEERNRGITMDVAQQQFETQSKLVTLLDAPGHRDFIPNMITGAAQADVSVLVVGSAVGEFESGFESGGQTREHAILARSLGVRQLAVAINKMDTVDWSESRFNEIVQKLKVFLKQAGFKDSDVSYVPCSGLTGENVMKPPTVAELTSWYHGPTLLERIDQFTPPPRPVEKPFRCCIADIFKAQGSGLSVAGRIESGHMQVGDSVLVQPANELATIRALSVSDDTATWAVAGDQVVATVAGIDITKLSLGSVLCSPEQPIKVTSRVEARIIVFNIDIPITTGFSVILHYQSLNEPAVIRKLISLLNKSSGELIKKKPRCLSKNSTAVIELEVSRPVCLELYQDCKELGRFMLRSRGNTIAAGVVTKIL